MSRRIKKNTAAVLTRPLETCEFKELKREIGVHVSEPFDLADPYGSLQACVDVCWEAPTVNTAEYGQPCAIETAPEMIKIGLVRCQDVCKKIMEFRRLVEELQDHFVVKLKKDMEAVENGTIYFDNGILVRVDE